MPESAAHTFSDTRVFSAMPVFSAMRTIFPTAIFIMVQLLLSLAAADPFVINL